MPVVPVSPAEVELEHPCPCGRRHSLAECCLPVALRLRAGAVSATPSPFDEIRASTALLLWGLLARERHRGICGPLSAAAHRFWGIALSAVPTVPSERPALWTVPDSEYGRGLFERTWGPSDPETLTWLLSTLPSPLRLDPLVGELALDWLLWDEPWLRGRPAAEWLVRSSFHLRPARVRRTCAGILRSRLGIWELLEGRPREGLLLGDRIAGGRILLHTPSDPWLDASQLLVARIYRFETWDLLGGGGLLVDQETAQRLLVSLETRCAGDRAPAPDDPRWHGWLKATMAPLIAGTCAQARLALPQLGAHYHPG